MNTRNLTLLTDLYELTMMQGYFESGENDVVVFDMFFRETHATTDILLPPDWNR